MKDPNLESLIGRRIVGAIVKEARQAGSQPSAQRFLILDDGTYCEVFTPTGRLFFSMAWPGAASHARSYMEATMETVYEAYSPRSLC